MSEPLPPTEPSESNGERKTRLTDGQALGLLGGWLVFRTITQRIGLGVGPKLLDTKPWVIPLLNNSSLLLIQAGTGTARRPAMFVVTLLASVFMSTLAGVIIYWAGSRFGESLAERAARPGSPWAGVWNPKAIARAERWMDRWGMAVVFVGRLTEYFTLPITLVAGASEMRFRRFIVAHTLGAIGFGGVYLWIGGVAQDRWPWLKDWISHTYGPWALKIGLGLLVLVVVLMGANALLSRKETAETQDLEKTTPSQPSSDSPPENDDPSRPRPVDS